MIYVLKSAGYDEDGNFINLIKIGYAKTWSRRRIAYRTENPTFRTLFLIDEGTMDDERNIHRHFKNYKFKCGGREWFRYDEDILDFFKMHNDIYKIRSVVIETSKDRAPKINYSDIKMIAGIILEKTHGRFSDYRELVTKMHDMKFKNISASFLWIRQNYGDIADEIVDSIEKWYSGEETLGRKEKELVNLVKRAKTFPEKMKILFQANKSVCSKILDFIPYPIKMAYLLGEERISALGWNSTRTNMELNDNMDLTRDLLRDAIYQEFSEGDKISRADIKTRLKDLYKKLNIRRTAKSVDLKNWFELKRVFVGRDEFRRRIGGFLLVKKL